VKPLHKSAINYASSSIASAIASRVIIYAPRVKLQIMASLTIIVYDRDMFIVQATTLAMDKLNVMGNSTKK